jgi:hypothetical protein
VHSSRPHGGRASGLNGIEHVTENATNSNFSNQGWKPLVESLRSSHKGLPRLAALGLKGVDIGTEFNFISTLNAHIMKRGRFPGVTTRSGLYKV